MKNNTAHFSTLKHVFKKFHNTIELPEYTVLCTSNVKYSCLKLVKIIYHQLYCTFHEKQLGT